MNVARPHCNLREHLFIEPHHCDNLDNLLACPAPNVPDCISGIFFTGGATTANAVSLFI